MGKFVEHQCELAGCLPPVAGSILNGLWKFSVRLIVIVWYEHWIIAKAPLTQGIWSYSSLDVPFSKKRSLGIDVAQDAGKPAG